MTEIFDRLKIQLQINSLELDNELIELPMLIMEVGEMSAAAQSALDQAKYDRDLAMSQAADLLRTTMITDAKGQPKLRSEAQIESEILLSPEVKVALEKLDDAAYNAARWKALQDAYRAKKDSLIKFSDLTISGYLSPNSALTNRRAEITEVRNRRRPLNSKDN